MQGKLPIPSTHSQGMIFHFVAGDLATVFMLEDRVSARTNAGGDSNEFNPGTAPDSATIAQGLVGNVSIADWAGNATIAAGMKGLRVSLRAFRSNYSNASLMRNNLSLQSPT